MTPKAEALAAIETALKMLDPQEPLSGLTRTLLHTALEHARDEVAKISELKRPRRAKAAKP